ncbi:MAG: tyrosine-type recombinase/integrase [Ruminococcus sp.]|nr:tyrosine-type recombinase/integrase [Ruminococcus sp.]
MAKRKKHPKLPNGYGQIRYLGKGRRNPYGVYPPAIYDENGKAISQKAICYVDTWIKGFIVLTSYKAGTYTPGDERDLEIDESADAYTFVGKLLADYNKMQGIEPEQKGLTFSEVYEKFWDYKYETEKGKKLSSASRRSTRAAYKNCKVLHDRDFRLLKLKDLQGVVDDCPLKHASLELIVTLLKQMYDYASLHDFCDKNYGSHVKINIEDDDESGVPFTEDELKTLWKHKSNDVVEFMLIMCYSGFRIAEYKGLNVDTNKKYFHGGNKTRSSKNRIVPIHSSILPLVKRRIENYGCLLDITDNEYRTRMYETLTELNIEKHTPHDCRHTFSALCEKYKVSENDRKRMLGHSFGKDITNAVYGHRDLEDLREEIEKIVCCERVVNKS